MGYYFGFSFGKIARRNCKKEMYSFEAAFLTPRTRNSQPLSKASKI